MSRRGGYDRGGQGPQRWLKEGKDRKQGKERYDPAAAVYDDLEILTARSILDQGLPTNLVIVQADILTSTEHIIAHQCNCVTPKAKGLADVIFTKWPSTDIYAERRSGKVKEHTPGTTIIQGGTGCPLIANMFAQYKGGQPRFAHGDTAMGRLAWFRSALHSIPSLVPSSVNSIAFPYLIGCGLAGGNWDVYLAELCKFAASLPGWKVVIYQLQT